MFLTPTHSTFKLIQGTLVHSNFCCCITISIITICSKSMSSTYVILYFQNCVWFSNWWQKSKDIRMGGHRRELTDAILWPLGGEYQGGTFINLWQSVLRCIIKSVVNARPLLTQKSVSTMGNWNLLISATGTVEGLFYWTKEGGGCSSVLQATANVPLVLPVQLRVFWVVATQVVLLTSPKFSSSFPGSKILLE